MHESAPILAQAVSTTFCSKGNKLSDNLTVIDERELASRRYWVADYLRVLHPGASVLIFAGRRLAPLCKIEKPGTVQSSPTI